MIKRNGPPPRDVSIRLVEQSFRTESGCLEWTGRLNRAGYAEIGIRHGRGYLAHRISWEIANGREVLPGHELHHICRNRCCIDPGHLTEVTRTQHAALHPEGRNRGEDRPMAKLTDEAVLAIRASSDTGVVLAARYGVCQMTLSRARRRLTWTHLP